MFNFLNVALLFAFALLLLQSPYLSAQEEFGRFFTTPKQREHLDQMRMKNPEQETVVVFKDNDGQQDKTKENTVSMGSIRLKGLVYRGNKKSTAWINDGNTYEGNLELQYFDVTEGDIDRDQVRMGVTGNQPGIKLRVGQTYDPDTDKISDITDAGHGAEKPPAPAR